MDLQQLLYFMTAAKHHSITKAAEILYVSQPSISTGILRLEAELGVALFDRKPRGIELTLAGKRFFPYAENILQSVDNAKNAMRASGSKQLVQIRVASAQYGLLPNLSQLYSLEGAVYISQFLYPNANICTMVADNKLDFGVIYSRQASEALEFVPVYREELVMLTQPGSSVKNAKLLDFKDAGFACNEVLFDRPSLETVCAQAGFTPKLMMETNEIPWTSRSFLPPGCVMLVPIHYLAVLREQFGMDAFSAVRVNDSYAVSDVYIVVRDVRSLEGTAIELFKFVDRSLKLKALDMSRDYPGSKIVVHNAITLEEDNHASGLFSLEDSEE